MVALARQSAIGLCSRRCHFTGSRHRRGGPRPKSSTRCTLSVKSKHNFQIPDSLTEICHKQRRTTAGNPQ
eukprot:4940794-Pyramimonas_sp.AAC.1